MERRPRRRKIKVGTVLSDKMHKTIVVRVDRLAMHATYHRTIRRAKKFKVHDEQNQAKPGDKVQIMEVRPLSKEKRWRLVKIMK